MKKLKLLIATLLITAGSLAQSNQPLKDSITKYIDTVLLLNKMYSIYGTSINWDSLRNLAYYKAKTSTTVKDLFAAIQFIYDNMGDNHGYFSYGGRRIGITYKQRDISPYIMNKIFGEHVGLQTTLINGKYQYILVPTIETDSIGESEWAHRIKDSLNSTASKENKGLIVDLRFNQGGNIFAMLGGFSDIIGNGIAGRLTNKDGATTNIWKIENGGVLIDEKLVCESGPVRNTRMKLPLVVLISEMTASSAEGLAIVLKGKSNCLLLGRKTWGVSTGLKYHKIDENCYIMITQSYMTDCNMNVYKNGVNPDKVITGGYNVKQLNADAWIVEAIHWIDGFYQH